MFAALFALAFVVLLYVLLCGVTPISGAGGKMDIGATPYHVGKWSLILDPRLVEVGTSSETGTRMKAVKTHATWTLETPWDSSNLPAAAGIDRGTEIASLKFKLGSSAVSYTIANTVVGNVEVVNDNNTDAVRLRISGAGGDVTGPA